MIIRLLLQNTTKRLIFVYRLYLTTDQKTRGLNPCRLTSDNQSFISDFGRFFHFKVFRMCSIKETNDTRMTQTQFSSLEYVIKHNPIMYFVKRKYFFIYQVVDREDNLIDFTFSRELSNVRCELFNSIYSTGYSIGVANALKCIV